MVLLLSKKVIIFPRSIFDMDIAKSQSTPLCTKHLSLKWRFAGDLHNTYLVNTRLSLGGLRALGIFHLVTQAVKRIITRRSNTLLDVYLVNFLI